jgi:hypothetical protein
VAVGDFSSGQVYVFGWVFHFCFLLSFFVTILYHKICPEAIGKLHKFYLKILLFFVYFFWKKMLTFPLLCSII